MKLGRLLSIRWRLLLLLATLGLPFLVFLLISTTRQAEHETGLAGQQMLSLARINAARLDDHIGDIRQILVVLSEVVQPLPENTAANDVLLQRMARSLPPQISNVAIWSLNGENVGAMDVRLRAAPVEVRERRFFKEALGSPDMVVEAPVLSHASGQVVGLFAHRIERNGQPIGVVVVATELARLQDLLALGSSLPSTAVVTVTDQTGMVLARSVDPGKWIGKNVLKGEGDVATSLQRRDGVRNGRSLDGVVRIAGFTMATRMPWLVYVGLPEDVVLGPVRTRLYENLAAGAAMLAVSMLVALWVAHRIAKPLRQLRDDAARLQAGDLGHRSTVRAGGEIDALATTLNRMAEALQTRNTSLEASQERLKQLAEHDPLTGLPNRTLLLDRLDVAIERSLRSRAPLALLFLDIDRFKAVNDTLGHAAGDKLLRSFANVLKAQVRKSDTVARFAGDEFVVLLERIGGVDDARRIAQSIVEHARGQLGGGTRMVEVSTSVGIAMYVEGETADSLLHRADDALYEAKRTGRDRLSVADHGASDAYPDADAITAPGPLRSRPGVLPMGSERG
jgi:diguanylate cyclase (GGDEF)-like protein